MVVLLCQPEEDEEVCTYIRRNASCGQGVW